MSHELIQDIPANKSWVKVESLLKGWSNDQKFYIKDRDGKEFLLRLVNISLYEKKKTEFENIGKLFKFNINIPKVVDFGICNDGNSVYSLFTWLSGEDAEDKLSLLDRKNQYKLGLEAGRIQNKIHSIKPKEILDSWGDTFQSKIDGVIEAYKICGYKIPNDNKIINFIRENENLLKDRPLAFIHGDYHLGNMLIDSNGNLGIIDFNRSGYGDPWKEYDRFVFTWGISTEFANGQIHGYFDNNVPDNFFKLMALYSARNLIASVPWSITFGEKELKVAFENIDRVYKAYNGFSTYIPNWYKKP